jgi:two-component system, OmpR family, response regulator ResD
LSGDILIVDDDVKIANIVARYLEQAGFATQAAHDGAAAWKLLAARSFSLIVLDVLLPDTTGLKILHDLRQPGAASTYATPSDVPVLILSALGMTDDIIGGLRDGADDYLVKPFEPRELVERIKALLRRQRSQKPPVSLVGSLAVSQEARLVKCAGQLVDLTRREYDLLIYLAGHPGRVFGRGQLLDAIWGGDYEGSDRAVDLCVLRLRTKLEQAGAGDVQVDTVWGAGYRLTILNQMSAP